ncbi:MAG: M48 family metallopeptidase [Anaerolineae bacterium]|nr:M48 family metallopeptidase [Anaerolineae bacterium]
MSIEVLIRQEERQSLALRITPGGVVVLVPRGLDAADPRVRRFIAEGLKRLPRPVALPAAGRLTREALRDLVGEWSARVGVRLGRVQVRAMRSKWASCSGRGNLTLSTALLALPRDLAEYVVCHELVHLKVAGHGKGWQALMGLYLPDWRERERRLAGWVVQDPERAVVGGSWS